MQFYISVVR